MRTRAVLTALAAALVITSSLVAQTPAPVAAPVAPKLIVLVVFDQMRWEYLTRYRDKMTKGFARLIRDGAVFSEARYPYAKTETAQGHATMLSGQPPAASGIISDSWFDRSTRASVLAGESTIHHLVGSTANGGSPEQMLVHTLGDMMKARDPRAIVLTASWKRYSAVLNGGQHADAAYWFDGGTGRMVTSDYYRRDYPAWADEFNKTVPTAAYLGKPWLTHTLAKTADSKFYQALSESPFANDILLAFVRRMLASSGLGKDNVTDLLAVSFSDTDYVGHAYGPETPEVDEAWAQADRQLDEFLTALDETVGKDQWTLALVADHGVATPVEKLKAQGIDAGTVSTTAMRTALRKAITDKWPGAEKAFITTSGVEAYLDFAEGAKVGATAEALEDVVVDAAKKQPGVQTAYTRSQIMAAAGTTDPMLAAVANTFYPARSGDVYIILKPNYYFSGAIHGSPHEYDVHVPLIFAGKGIAPGKYDRHVFTWDLAPTLAEIAGVKLPGVPGKSLSEALKK